MNDEINIIKNMNILFLNNAIENGWKAYKINGSYTFDNSQIDNNNNNNNNNSYELNRNITRSCNAKTIQKMLFIYNAVESGWHVYKNNDAYVFLKKHHGKREMFDENFLNKFITSNFTI